jgi:signal peptidase I
MSRFHSQPARVPDLERSAMAWPPETWEAYAGQADFGDTGVAVPTPPAPRQALWREILETALLTLVISLGIHAVVQSRQVEGSSMEPTLHTGERLLINKFAYLGFGEPQRGDIVVFRAWGQEEDFIKRIVGVPGDRIEVRDDAVYVNGQRLAEPYLDQITAGAGRDETLGEGEYYVLGDNRGNSSDSRLFGSLEREDIVGKALVRYWPPKSADWLADRAPYALAR